MISIGSVRKRAHRNTVATLFSVALKREIGRQIFWLPRPPTMLWSGGGGDGDPSHGLKINYSAILYHVRMAASIFGPPRCRSGAGLQHVETRVRNSLARLAVVAIETPIETALTAKGSLGFPVVSKMRLARLQISHEASWILDFIRSRGRPHPWSTWSAWVGAREMFSISCTRTLPKRRYKRRPNSSYATSALIPPTSKRTLDPTMLHILPTRGDHKIAEPGLVTTDALWVDLLNPTSAEVTSVEEAIGAKLPTLGALSEIESSSRLRNRGGILYMSTPSAAGRPEGAQTTPPIGFVLSTDRLITVRFMPLPSFDAVVSKFASSHDAPKSSLEVFTLLSEEIVDHVADILEQLAGELNGLSIDAFRADDTRGRHAARANHVLRVQLAEATSGRSARGHSFPDRVRGATVEQGAVCPGCPGRANRHCSERRVQGLDHSLDRRHPPDLDGGNLWHELQEHAGIRLALGLSIRLDGYHPQRAHSAGLVQAERLVLATDRRAPKTELAINVLPEFVAALGFVNAKAEGLEADDFSPPQLLLRSVQVALP